MASLYDCGESCQPERPLPFDPDGHTDGTVRFKAISGLMLCCRAGQNLMGYTTTIGRTCRPIVCIDVVTVVDFFSISPIYRDAVDFTQLLTTASFFTDIVHWQLFETQDLAA